MKFEVDSQTLKDLEIFGTTKDQKSIFDLFNFTHYLGGKRKLHQYLLSPSTDIDEIRKRIDIIRFFHYHLPGGLVVDKDDLSFSEYYFKQSGSRVRRPSKFFFFDRFMDKINASSDYFLAEKGVKSTISLLRSIHLFSIQIETLLQGEFSSQLLKENNVRVLDIFKKEDFKEILEIKEIKAFDISRFDYLFRFTERRSLNFFFDLVYEYDAFRAVAQAAERHGFAYPDIQPTDNNCLEVDSLFHPFVDNAISNNLSLDSSDNLLFVSGPNMAGKSTFLKSLGIATYLAHVGFPVPAQRMRLSVLSGIYTTINISDNLNSGYSHFYAEVMRVKEVADRMNEHNNMLVIFDELFRGTNVKDAYDGTLAIVSALATIRTSFFVISTHIVEVADKLKDIQNINFGYFDIEQENGHPKYTYKLRQGVSDVRLGMYIINQEGVVDLINQISKKDKY